MNFKTNKKKRILRIKIKTKLNYKYIVPCATNNETNAQPEIQYDENLDEQPQSCLELDKEYVEVNSITDQLFFQINNALDIYIDKDGTKTLFYKPYPFWNKDCNGRLFLIAQEQQNTLLSYRKTENANFILVIAYLLICNYGLPMIPYIFRCVGPLSIKTLTYLDYLLRIVLSGTMTYLSFLNLDYGKQLLDSLDELWGMQCIKDEENVYGRFEDQIGNQRALDIVAITFSFVLWAIEGSLLWILGCQETVKKCRRGYRRLKIKKDVENAFDRLNQSQQMQ